MLFVRQAAMFQKASNALRFALKVSMPQLFGRASERKVKL